MSKKWRSFFASIEPSHQERAKTASAASAAGTVAGIAPSIAPAQRDQTIPPAPLAPGPAGGFRRRIQRDPAQDALESVEERVRTDLGASKTHERKDIQPDPDRFTAESHARMQVNFGEIGRENQPFFGWRLKTQDKEQKFAGAVSYLVTESPITTRPAPPAGKPAHGAAAAPVASSPGQARKAGE